MHMNAAHSYEATVVASIGIFWVEMFFPSKTELFMWIGASIYL